MSFTRTGDDQANEDRGAGTAECDECGQLKPVCCGAFNWARPTADAGEDWEPGPLDYKHATCRDCCAPRHALQHVDGIGGYERGE